MHNAESHSDAESHSEAESRIKFGKNYLGSILLTPSILLKSKS